MPEVEVKQVSVVDSEGKSGVTTIYKTVLQGDNTQEIFGKYFTIKVKVVLESESKEALNRLCPMEIGEKRRVRFDYLNHNLSEFVDKKIEKEMEAYRTQREKDEEAHQARLKAAQDAGIEGIKGRDDDEGGGA